MFVALEINRKLSLWCLISLFFHSPAASLCFSHPPGLVLCRSSSQDLDQTTLLFSHHIPFFFKMNTHTWIFPLSVFFLIVAGKWEKVCACLCDVEAIFHKVRARAADLSGFILELVTWILKRDRLADKTRCMCVYNSTRPVKIKSRFRASM